MFFAGSMEDLVITQKGSEAVWLVSGFVVCMLSVWPVLLTLEESLHVGITTTIDIAVLQLIRKLKCE